MIAKKFFASMLISSAVAVPAWSANVRYEGVAVTEQIERSGKDMNATVHISRNLRTQVNRVSTREVWSSERIPMPTCQASSGAGGGDWKGFWDSTTASDKARRLALAIAGLGDEGAQQIVRDGYFRTMPRSWAEFTAEIRRADNQPDSLGYSSRVLGAYAEQNKRNLDYSDTAPNTAGGGDWKGYWDVGTNERPSRLVRAVRGLTEESARAIVFSGALDRLPRDWRAFADAISSADQRAQRGFSYTVLVVNGAENMRALGYYDSNACTMGSATERVLKSEEVKEFDHTAQRQVEIDVVNAPLLKGEKETLTLSFDGVNDEVSVRSEFYRYQRERSLDSSGAATYRFTGERQQVAPVNTVSVVVSKDGAKVVLDVSDGALDGDFVNQAGETVVNIEIWQSRFLFDKKLGTMQVKLNAMNQPLRVNTEVKPSSGAKVYAYYSIQRVGSRFYNAQSSSKAYSEKLQF